MGNFIIKIKADGKTNEFNHFATMLFNFCKANKIKKLDVKLNDETSSLEIRPNIELYIDYFNIDMKKETELDNE